MSFLGILTCLQFLGSNIQVHPFITLQQRVALHNLKVEIRQWHRLLFIDDKSKPETEAGNIYGSLLYINTINVVLNNVALDVGSIILLEDFDRLAARIEFTE